MIEPEKLVVLGDPETGKTSLINGSYRSNRHLKMWRVAYKDQTIMGQTLTVEYACVDNQKWNDESSGNAYREKLLEDASGYLICVATDMQSSFLSLQKWVRAIYRVQLQPRLYLIRTKKDLEDAVEHPVDYFALEEAKNKL